MKRRPLLSLEPQERCAFWLGSALAITGTPGRVCFLVGKCPCYHWNPRSGVPFGWEVPLLSLEPQEGCALWLGSATAVTGTPGAVCPLIGKCPCCHWDPRKGVLFGWEVPLLSLELQGGCALWLGSALAVTGSPRKVVPFAW